MNTESTNFSVKAVKFKGHNKDCNVVVWKEFKYMGMSVYRINVNTTRSMYTSQHGVFEFQEPREG